jgi:hypothetical protein
MPEMNPEIKAQWTAALRSGEYQQGTGQLAQKHEGEWQFCCLGVLCELAVKADQDVTVTDGNIDRLYDGQAALLPRSVAGWAGINTYGDFYADGYDQSLTAKNDNGMPFTEIADLIEKYL